MRQSVAPAQSAVSLRKALRDALGEIGLFEAGPAELDAGRALAAELIGPGVVEADVLRAVAAHAGYGAYVVREGGSVIGLLSMILLNPAGVQALREDVFDALHPRLDHVAANGSEPAAVYGWGVAGATREAAKTVVAGSALVLEVIPVPYFARAATEAGLRMLTRLGFAPYPNSPSGLLWRDPRDLARRAA